MNSKATDLEVSAVLDITIIILLKFLIEIDNDPQVRSRQRLFFIRRENTSSLHDILNLIKER